MAQRAATYLKWVDGRWGKSAFIDLEMPTGINPDLQRDGLIGGKGRDGMTQMGWRLLHFVRATPLSAWTDIFSPFN